jgi:hypothetical protein
MADLAGEHGTGDDKVLWPGIVAHPLHVNNVSSLNSRCNKRGPSTIQVTLHAVWQNVEFFKL